MTDSQQLITWGILIIIGLAIAFLSWDLAVGRYRTAAKKREKAIASTQKQYAEILAKLNEDPQAYAMGLGVSYVIRTLRATLDAIEEELEKPA